MEIGASGFSDSFERLSSFLRGFKYDGLVKSQKNTADVMLNLIQHLTKSRIYETLKSQILN